MEDDGEVEDALAFLLYGNYTVRVWLSTFILSRVPGPVRRLKSKNNLPTVLHNLRELTIRAILSAA